MSERHHRNDNSFGDYFLYSMLLGNGNAFATFGLISGDLSFGEAMALSLLTGTRRDGSIFRPYSYNEGYGWGRQPTVIQNVRVTNIQYGTNPPTQFTGKRPKPPAGFAKSKPIPKSNNKVATVKKGADGKPTVQVVKKANASKIISGKAAVPPVVKQASSTATTIANPSRLSQTNGTTPVAKAPATKTTTAPATGTKTTSAPAGGTKTTSAPAKAPAPAPKAPAPAPKAPSAPSGRR